MSTNLVAHPMKADTLMSNGTLTEKHINPGRTFESLHPHIEAPISSLNYPSIPSSTPATMEKANMTTVNHVPYRSISSSELERHPLETTAPSLCSTSPATKPRHSVFNASCATIFTLAAPFYWALKIKYLDARVQSFSPELLLRTSIASIAPMAAWALHELWAPG